MIKSSSNSNERFMFSNDEDQWIELTDFNKWGEFEHFDNTSFIDFENIRINEKRSVSHEATENVNSN